MPRLTQELQFPNQSTNPRAPYNGVAVFCKNGSLYTIDTNGTVALIGSGSGGTADLSNYYTINETDNAISTAINALIDGAPGTLDTLKELADAVNSNKSLVDALNEAISNKQDTLVSGTNIKTINGESILGTGDITISGGTENAIPLTGSTSLSGDFTPSVDAGANLGSATEKFNNIHATHLGTSASPVNSAHINIINVGTNIRPTIDKRGAFIGTDTNWFGGLYLAAPNSVHSGSLVPPTSSMSKAQTWRLPNASGTIALTTDIPQNVIKSSANIEQYIDGNFFLLGRLRVEVDSDDTPHFRLRDGDDGNTVDVYLEQKYGINNQNYRLDLPLKSGTLATLSDIPSGGADLGITREDDIVSLEDGNILSMTTTGGDPDGDAGWSIEHTDYSGSGFNYQHTDSEGNNYYADIYGRSRTINDVSDSANYYENFITFAHQEPDAEDIEVTLRPNMEQSGEFTIATEEWVSNNFGGGSGGGSVEIDNQTIVRDEEGRLKTAIGGSMTEAEVNRDALRIQSNSQVQVYNSITRDDSVYDAQGNEWKLQTRSGKNYPSLVNQNNPFIYINFIGYSSDENEIPEGDYSVTISASGSDLDSFNPFTMPGGTEVQVQPIDGRFIPVDGETIIYDEGAGVIRANGGGGSANPNVFARWEDLGLARVQSGDNPYDQAEGRALWNIEPGTGEQFSIILKDAYPEDVSYFIDTPNGRYYLGDSIHEGFYSNAPYVLNEINDGSYIFQCEWNPSVQIVFDVSEVEDPEFGLAHDITVRIIGASEEEENTTHYFGTFIEGNDPFNGAPLMINPMTNRTLKIANYNPEYDPDFQPEDPGLPEGTPDTPVARWLNENLKTINGKKILGPGNITIQGGGEGGGASYNYIHETEYEDGNKDIIVGENADADASVTYIALKANTTGSKSSEISVEGSNVDENDIPAINMTVNQSEGLHDDENGSGNAHIEVMPTQVSISHNQSAGGQSSNESILLANNRVNIWAPEGLFVNGAPTSGIQIYEEMPAPEEVSDGQIIAMPTSPGVDVIYNAASSSYSGGTSMTSGNTRTYNSTGGAKNYWMITYTYSGYYTNTLIVPCTGKNFYGFHYNSTSTYLRCNASTDGKSITLYNTGQQIYVHAVMAF